MAKTLTLGQSLDHQATGRLATELSGDRGAVVLDASAVEHVGGLFAQMVVHTRKTAANDRMLTLVNPSAACIEGFARLGIAIDELT